MAFFAALILLGLARPAFSQTTGEIRTIPLVVMTQNGRMVTGVRPENLRVKGSTATVRSVALDTNPRHIVLLLDISGSMAGGNVGTKYDRWENAKLMAAAFLGAVPSTEGLALDVFAKSEKRIVPYTHDFAAIRRAIDSLPNPGSKEAEHEYGGLTYLGDALSAILTKQKDPFGFGDAVVVFSDGEFRSDGKVTMGKIRPQLEACGVRLFLGVTVARLRIPHALVSNASAFPNIFLLSEYVNGEPEQEQAAEFAAGTGGAAFQPTPSISPEGGLVLDSIDKEMARAGQFVQETYRVELELSQRLKKNKTLHLEFVDSQGKRVPNVSLFYPSLLVPQTKIPH